MSVETLIKGGIHMSHTNYNSISNEKKGDPNSKTPEVEKTKEPEIATEPEFVFGTVSSDCAKLNVRKEPYLGAPILCVIEKGTQVLVIPEESTDLWYKVDIGGQQGFCMKKYMTTNV
jgi:uncharacterized protein YgiM (DUF1202 family)